MGHWGTYAAHPRRGRNHALAACSMPAIELPAVIPPTAQCSNCETWVVLAGCGSVGADGRSDGNARDLPPGWKIIDGAAVCPDCAPPARGALRSEIRERAPSRAIPSGFASSRRHGCRIGHEITLGVAAIDLRAGDRAPPGRDERVSLLLDAECIDKLIIELSTIRAKLSANKVRPS